MCVFTTCIVSGCVKEVQQPSDYIYVYLFRSCSGWGWVGRDIRWRREGGEGEWGAGVGGDSRRMVGGGGGWEEGGKEG